MVKAIKGKLIETEPSIKEVILLLGENENFIIEDINDTAVFVKDTTAPGLKRRVDNIMSPGSARE